MMGSVFAMQGIGQFAAAIVALIVTSAFKVSSCTLHEEHLGLDR
jgi:PHS family inorganic phosphate transporter-like MFS transporter